MSKRKQYTKPRCSKALIKIFLHGCQKETPLSYLTCHIAEILVIVYLYIRGTDTHTQDIQRRILRYIYMDVEKSSNTHDQDVKRHLFRYFYMDVEMKAIHTTKMHLLRYFYMDDIKKAIHTTNIFKGSINIFLHECQKESKTHTQDVQRHSLRYFLLGCQKGNASVIFDMPYCRDTSNRLFLYTRDSLIILHLYVCELRGGSIYNGNTLLTQPSKALEF